MSSREIMMRALDISATEAAMERLAREKIRAKIKQICDEHPGERHVSQKNRVMAALIEFNRVEEAFAIKHLQTASLRMIGTKLIEEGLPLKLGTTKIKADQEECFLELID